MTDYQGTDDQNLARLSKLVRDLEQDLDPNVAGSTAHRATERKDGGAGDLTGNALAAQDRLDNIRTRYQAALQSLLAAERQQRDDAAKPSAVKSPETKATAATRKTARGTSFLNMDAEPDDFYKDIEDALAIGQLTDNEATRRSNAYIERRREAIAARKEKEAANRQAASQAQQRADATRQNAATNRRLDIQEGRATAQDTRAAATERRLTANAERQATTEQYRLALGEGDKAVSRAEKKRLADQNAAYASARAAGRSPQEALSAAEALPPLDIDEISERAIDRILTRLGVPPAPGTTQPPSAAATPTPAPPVPMPATSTAPTGAIGQAAQAAMAATPVPAGAAPSTYPDEIDRALGRARLAA